MIVLHSFMILLMNYYQIEISRFFITEKFYGNILWIITVLQEYIGKIVSLQVYDGYIHVYCNTEFITIHQLSSKQLNYIFEHYVSIAKKSHVFKDEHITDRAKENLEIIRKVYDYE